MEKINPSRLYFAYGSNLDFENMNQKCTKPLVLGIARLEGHRIGFFENSVIWDGAVETVVPDVLAEVWGVLYQLESYAWEQLDNCEDVRLDGTGEYFHYPVEVLDEQNRVIEASIYKKARLGEPKQPSTEYLNIIIQGAKEQGLPKEYIETLESIASKPASYAVPRQRGQSKKQACGECNGCSES
ncbi:gamma-glutamylcyclotransferase family protein [Pelosinus propionicus]|uniref:AIG2-like family protein n=1 Tax=Pelosinus propionicus DSM 13327 TaxID=1123291 RepID=A0A1I4PQM8_9FIRM|nr:gamma-glutamylcyclotransferase family protein [Pelosinus propionicus]SFM30058.1 AIG2-like family protein [Pelosinus propionicus DSM 13327]